MSLLLFWSFYFAYCSYYYLNYLFCTLRCFHRRFVAFDQVCILYSLSQLKVLGCYLREYSGLNIWAHGDNRDSLGVESESTLEKNPLYCPFFLSELLQFLLIFLSEFVFLEFKFRLRDFDFFVLKYMGAWLKLMRLVSAELKLIPLLLYIFEGDPISWAYIFKLNKRCLTLNHSDT